MTATVHSRAAALLSLCFAAGCTESVDCAQEPQRCPHVAANTPAAKPPARAQQQVAIPQNAGERLAQVPAKALAETLPLPAGAPTRDELKALVATLQLPAKTENLPGLKPFITQRLYDTLGPLVAANSARLWRHLAKFGTAAETGFRTEVESVEADRVQLHLTLPNGEELRPIVVRENGVWKIDRF
jgi:predicted lipid-binding transport protein (Tim44 family)